jgi:hypothetical protein
MHVLMALVLLTMATPVFAQTSGSSSGSMAAVNITNPANANSTSRLITTPPWLLQASLRPESKPALVRRLPVSR